MHLRIASRPSMSGSIDDDLAVKPARSQQRAVEHFGPVRRGQEDHPELASKPSISTSN